MNHRPSWIDRFYRWLERLPGPTWMPYLGIYLSFAVIVHIAVWADGVETPGTIVPAVLIESVWSILLLAFIHYLTNASLRAMDRFAPLVSSENAVALRQRLSHLPARPVFWLGLSFGLFIALGAITANDAVYDGGPNTLIAKIVLVPAMAVGYSFTPVIIYYVVRLLRTISLAFAAVPEVSIFRQQPLRAFAGVTMRASLLFIVIANLNFLVDAVEPDGLGANTLDIVLSVLAYAGAIAVFVLPLVGVHQRLRDAKAAALDENGRHMDELSRRLYGSMGTANADDLSILDKSLAATQRVRDHVRSQHTWPWDPGTLRAFLTAVILPLVVWGLQNWLSRTL